jgi:hypothetical protein
MARLIAYDPRTQTTEGIFYGPVGGVGGVMSLMLDREGREQKWAESKSAPDPKSAPRPKNLDIPSDPVIGENTLASYRR